MNTSSLRVLCGYMLARVDHSSASQINVPYSLEKIVFLVSRFMHHTNTADNVVCTNHKIQLLYSNLNSLSRVSDSD